ncbi:MAG TPA: TetR/AcrR family transcriptional regulator [Acidimicrobiales bacterium]|nr:TetR/AcrR family transcriptional regulator [Acidimicrobiales bacterium]
MSAADDVEVSIWERIARPARSLTTLDHERIAAAAIDIADADGLDAVSMRRLAGQLGVATMALYRYVSGKEDIFWLMVDAAFDDVDLDPDGAPGDWQVVLRDHARRVRAGILRHPWVGEAGARVLIGLTPRRMAGAERVLVSIGHLDLDADTGLAVFQTVNAYVWGATGGEVTQLRLMRRQGFRSGDDLRTAYSRHMRWLMDTGRYPTYQRSIRAAKRKDDHDWRFEFGLDCVIEGIGKRLSI